MEGISKSCILHMDCTTAQGDKEGIPLSMQTNTSRAVKAIRFCFRGVRGGRGAMGRALSDLVALVELKCLQASCPLAMLLPRAVCLPLSTSFRTHHLLQITDQTKLGLILSETGPKFLPLS